MKKIIKLKNKYGMIVCVLFCMIYFCLGCGQEDETVFLEQKEELSEETEKTNETEVEKESKPKESEESETEDRENKSAGQEQICVFVCGFVRNPGVYYLNINARLYEAVEAAGGFLEEADAGWLNQAEILSDGDKVRIYSKEESGTAEKSVETNQQNQTQDAGKVNINTASAEELQTIPGIGAAKAAAIIEYREVQGEFKSTEEIQNVPGIKGKTFEKIQPYLTAG